MTTAGIGHDWAVSEPIDDVIRRCDEAPAVGPTFDGTDRLAAFQAGPERPRPGVRIFGTIAKRRRHNPPG